MNTYKNLTVTTDTLNLPAVDFFNFFLVKVLIYRKMQATDFHPHKVFRCPCLINVIDNIFDFVFRSFDEILAYLKNLEIMELRSFFMLELLKKGFDCNLRQTKVTVIGLFNISFSNNQETDFVFDLSKKQNRFCEGCVRHYCQELVAFFKFCNV